MNRKKFLKELDTRKIDTVKQLRISKKDLPNFIDKTINWLGRENSDYQAIYDFLKKSNTNLGDSYYVLRKNMTDKEAIDKEKNSKIDRFVKSCYVNTTRSESMKKRNKENRFSMGITGYTEIMPDGKSYYCRSTPEYVFIQYFFAKFYPKYEIRYEQKFFTAISYKPDFFIYKNDGKFIGCVEVKEDSWVLDERFMKIKEYFDSICTRFEIFKDVKGVYSKYPEIKQKTLEWKKKDSTISNTAGPLNPRYINVSDEEIISNFKKKYVGVDYPITASEYRNFAFEKKYPQVVSDGCCRIFSVKSLVEDINKINGFNFKNTQQIREYRKKKNIKTEKLWEKK